MKKLALMAVLLAAAGCSSTIPYQNAGPTNLAVSIESKVSGFMTISSIDFDVYQNQKANCDDLFYVGSVSLEAGKPRHVSLSTNRWAYVQIHDYKNSFWHGKKIKDVRFRFKPQAGYHYKLVYEVDNNGYGLNFSQRAGGAKSWTQAPRDSWNSCQNNER